MNKIKANVYLFIIHKYNNYFYKALYICGFG